MRVLTIAACPLPWPRGTPIRVHRIAEGLTQRHQVTVLTYPLGDPQVAVPYELVRVDSSPDKLDPSPGPNLRKFLRLDPQLWQRCRKLLRQQHFDVIHAHHYEGLLVALAAREHGNPPIVYDAHTLLASELPYYTNLLPTGLLGQFGGWLDRTLPRRADHIIAVTRQMRDWYRSIGIADTQLSLIPNGVEIDHFVTDTLAPTTPILVFAGSLAPYQGLPLLLDAFALVRKNHADATLTVISSDNSDELVDLAHQRGVLSSVNVVPTSFDLLPEQLACASVLINPRPLCDGIPQKLLNYMAAGQPIVSCAGSAHILEHERNALVVPDANVTALAAAIERILADTDLARRLGAYARRDARERHDWSQVAAAVSNVYEQVAT